MRRLEVVVALVYLHAKLNKESNILICTPSNGAIDNIVTQLSSYTTDVTYVIKFLDG